MKKYEFFSFYKKNKTILLFKKYKENEIKKYAFSEIILNAIYDYKIISFEDFNFV
jgi:regulatory protein YycI of two-component signal transduction system YycFG